MLTKRRFVILGMVSNILVGCALSVPNGYVSTPNGLMHVDCIRVIHQGEHVSDQGIITYASGKTEQLARCKHPRLDNHTFRRLPPFNASNRATSQENPVSGMWVEDAWWPGAKPGGLTATFQVPASPQLGPNQAEALIYLFPGLQGESGILQPVLQYGVSPIFLNNGGQWIAVSWYCCPNENEFYSDSISVSPGDEITGTITATCVICREPVAPCSSNTCNWSVVTSATGKPTVTLLAGPINGLFQKVVGGALETYGLIDCTQLPSSGSTSFGNIVVTDQAGKTLSPNWRPEIRAVVPLCRFDVPPTKDKHSVTLSY